MGGYTSKFELPYVRLGLATVESVYTTNLLLFGSAGSPSERGGDRSARRPESLPALKVKPHNVLYVTGKCVSMSMTHEQSQSAKQLPHRPWHRPVTSHVGGAANSRVANSRELSVRTRHIRMQNAVPK